MTAHSLTKDASPVNHDVSRREFVQLLGAGILVTVSSGGGVSAQPPIPAPRPAKGSVAARLHIGEDGAITVLTGKVEMGQGSRAQISQAAAEELRVAIGAVTLIMADTALVPDDGITAGSRTTPSTIPAVRKGAAAAREILIGLACETWGAKRGDVDVKNGTVVHRDGKRSISYGDLARKKELAEAFGKAIPSDVALTPVREWKVMGRSEPAPNRRNLVTGAHRFPSDVTRPGMLRGKVLRAPSYGATLDAIDLSVAEAMDNVVVVRDGDFVGCAAATVRQASKAIEALEKTAKWKPAPHPSSKELFAHLKRNAQSGGGGGRGSGGGSKGNVEDALSAAKHSLAEAYEVAYIQHAPLEPRAAVAEWDGDSLTVWTGSQAPNRIHSELMNAFRLPEKQVRVIIPDMGGGFGGKHSGETATEAARMARAAKRPVSLQWTRAEEFTWAYFRPAALIETRGGLDAQGKITAWDFTDINAGSSALETPYEVPNKRAQSQRSNNAPLRPGSYRCLAATANNFARESFMDELAAAAKADPLAFRLDHLKHPRLRAVLEAAAKRFGWAESRKRQSPGTGIGLACGTEKASYVAACVEVEVDREKGAIRVVRVTEVFECGAVQNPDNLLAQIQGCIIMGLGGALNEEMHFEGGKILNASFGQYKVPRFKDVPPLDIQVLDRPDLESVGGGETPIIVIAPAIANAVFHATGVRIRTMPIRGEALKRV